MLSVPLLISQPRNQTPFTMIKKLLTLSALVVFVSCAYQTIDQKADTENAVMITRGERALTTKVAVRQMVKAGTVRMVTWASLAARQL